MQALTRTLLLLLDTPAVTRPCLSHACSPANVNGALRSPDRELYSRLSWSPNSTHTLSRCTTSTIPFQQRHCSLYYRRLLKTAADAQDDAQDQVSKLGFDAARPTFFIRLPGDVMGLEDVHFPQSHSFRMGHSYSLTTSRPLAISSNPLPRALVRYGGIS